MLAFEGEECDILHDIRKGNREGAREDAVARAAQELKKSSGKSLRSAEWRESQDLLYFRDRIYVPKNVDLQRRIVEQHHDMCIAGHAGRWKTLELVSRNYWWPQMSRYISKYCKTCNLCLCTKAQHQLPISELKPLSISEGRWDAVSVDFIVELPESEGYDVIMVVVDSRKTRTPAYAARILHHWQRLPSSGYASRPSTAVMGSCPGDILN